MKNQMPGWAGVARVGDMRTENRKSPRVAKVLDGHAERVATVLAEGEDREVKVRVVDVSREGVGFVAAEPFDKDAFIRLSLMVADRVGATMGGKRFVTSAVVRNCSRREDGTFAVAAGYRVGVKLKEQSGRELDAWNDLISMWSRKEF